MIPLKRPFIDTLTLNDFLYRHPTRDTINELWLIELESVR